MKMVVARTRHGGARRDEKRFWPTGYEGRKKERRSSSRTPKCGKAVRARSFVLYHFACSGHPLILSSGHCRTTIPLTICDDVWSHLTLIACSVRPSIVVPLWPIPCPYSWFGSSVGHQRGTPCKPLRLGRGRSTPTIAGHAPLSPSLGPAYPE